MLCPKPLSIQVPDPSGIGRTAFEENMRITRIICVDMDDPTIREIVFERAVRENDLETVNDTDAIGECK